MLALQLKLENGLITEAEFDEQLVREQRRCLKRFELIQMASTVLVDEVIEACTPVESIIFDDSDPLRFQSLLSVLGLGDIDTVEELAGLICVGKEFLVDLIVVLEVPRPFFDGLFDSFDPSDFLDPRCIPFDVGTTALGRLLQ